MKPLRRILRASGPLPHTNPEAHSLPSTNNLCVTTSSASSGLKSPLAPSCPLTSSTQLARNTGKPFASWLDASWTNNRPITKQTAERADVRDQLEGLVVQMVERG